VIDIEESQEGNNQDSSDSKTNFLFKEEFKMIMQLVFSLSEYDLKHELIDHKQEQAVEAGARRSSKKKVKSEPHVVIQPIEDIRQKYDPQCRESSLITSAAGPDDESLKVLHDVLRKYKPGRVQDLLKFFFRNKRLINKLICLNQTAINE